MPFSTDTRLSSASLGKFGIFDGDASSLDKLSAYARSAMVKIVKNPVVEKAATPVDKLLTFRENKHLKEASIVIHELTNKIEEIANRKPELSPLADSAPALEEAATPRF